jgi:hypothetical protein
VASKNVILYYKNVILIPLEVEQQIKQFGNLDEIKETGNKNLEFIKQTLMQKEEKNEDGAVTSFLGVFGAIIATNPYTIKVKSVKPCDIDMFGRYTRGALLVEKYEHLISGKLNNVTIIDEVDTNEILKVLNYSY